MSEAASQPVLGLWSRLLVRLPRLGTDPDAPSLGQRMSRAFLKPVDADSTGPSAPASAEVRQEEARRSEDKERNVGLFAAPAAAVIAILVIGSLVANDPRARIHGLVDKLHVNPTLYNEVLVVLLGLSVVIMVGSLLRKRLMVGVALSLYGLAIFNLKYWGFGFPFILAGAWLLVRSYRAQRDQRAAEGGRVGRYGPGVTPASSKRYTPPTARAGRPTR